VRELSGVMDLDTLMRDKRVRQAASVYRRALRKEVEKILRETWSRRLS